MKKFLFLTFGLLFLCNVSKAQKRTLTKQFNVNPNQELELNLKFGDTIKIEAWDKNEVSFEANIEINQGKLNNALVFNFDEQPERLQVSADFDQELLKKGRATDCPDSNYASYNWSDNGKNNVVCSNITYVLYIPDDIDISVESISGDIELVNLSGPIKAKSISGYVDLSWPAGKPANINLKTISGEAFTDIEDLQFTNKKDHIPLVGYTIKATLLGGGPGVALESISGNIYLRKSQS